MRPQRVHREKARVCRTPSDTVVDAPPPPRHSPRDPKLAPTSPARSIVTWVAAGATFQGFSGPRDAVRTSARRQPGRSNMRRPALSPAVSQGRLRTSGRRAVQPHGSAPPRSATPACSGTSARTDREKTPRLCVKFSYASAFVSRGTQPFSLAALPPGRSSICGFALPLAHASESLSKPKVHAFERRNS